MYHPREFSIDLGYSVTQLSDPPHTHLVLIVVVEKLAECQQVCEAEQETEDLQPGLSAQLAVLGRTHQAGGQRAHLLYRSWRVEMFQSLNEGIMFVIFQVGQKNKLVLKLTVTNVDGHIL